MLRLVTFSATMAGIVGGVLMHSSLLLAQAQVVDISDQAIEEAPAVLPSGNSAYQLQQLQTEVMQLRGILEEQQHAIRRLQQSRLDDYRNIDKRLLELQQGAIAVKRDDASVVGSGESSSQVATVGAKETYSAAYANIKKQDFPQAVIAFESFIPQYPDSTYTGNAYYWLGELYVLRGDLDLAKKSYLSLLEKFPAHRKVADASYKLARVYHEQGSGGEAKTLLQKVVNDYSGKASGTAQLAKDFLSKNYP